MSDNRIITRSKYVVTRVSGSTVGNNISKRPYTDSSASPSKRQNASDSFDDTLHSTSSNSSSNDDSSAFPNELENMLRLKSEENSRLVQAKFANNNLNTSNHNKNITETEFHNKLSQAMGTEVDVSTLYKKIELLNSLKNES